MNVIVRKPDENESKKMLQCSTWGCEPSVFDWSYDQQETCLIIEGEVTVKYDDKEISFGKGDYVIFPKGLSCVWDVKKAVKKYYFFD